MASYPTTVLADSPVAYWRFGDASKANLAVAADTSGTGNTATYFGTNSNATGLLINDSDTAVTKTLATNTTIYSLLLPVVAGATITIEMIVNRTSVGANLAMLYTQSSVPLAGQTGQYMCWGGAFGYNPRDFIFAPHGNAGAPVGVWLNAIPAGPNSDGTAINVHQVVTFNDTTHIAELFINGVSQGTRTVASAGTTSDNGITYIGNWAAASNFFNYEWNGIIDEVSVYNSVLSSTRILAHYQAATSGAASSNLMMMGVG